MHNPLFHPLPKAIGNIMKPGLRTWPALTEENIAKASAAWAWLQEYAALNAAQPGRVSMGSGRLSKLFQRCSIVRRRSEPDQAFASLGNTVWAGLGTPLVRVQVDGQTHWAFGGPGEAQAQFIFAHDPSEWEALTFLVTRKLEHGLLLQPTGALPLVVNTLREGYHKLLDLSQSLSFCVARVVPTVEWSFGCGSSVHIKIGASLSDWAMGQGHRIKLVPIEFVHADGPGLA